MITIFTATYNREKLLQRLYYSLQNQTCKAFEWIVIDDGSTDNTQKMVEGWKKHENHFSIRYLKVPHGGKHRAINKGVQMARSPAFMTVDSDDYLVPQAVSLGLEWFETIQDNPRFAGVSGLRGSSETQCLGGGGVDNGKAYIDGNLFESRKLNLLGDKAEIYKTDIMKRYPFPEFEQEDFISENVVWYKIAKDGYSLRWYKKIIYICQYLPNGLTRNMASKLVDNPIGWLETIKTMRYGWDKKETEYQYFVWKILTRKYNDNKGGMEEYNLQWVKTKLNEVIESTNRAIQKNNIETYAIYGMGLLGRLFVELHRDFDGDFRFAIDYSVSSYKNYKIIRPEDFKFGCVDAVIITMKEQHEEILNFLTPRVPKVLFWRNIWD